VAVAFCEFVPPLIPAPDHVYVNAAGPPFNATDVVAQVIEFGEVAVGLGNTVFCVIACEPVVLHPLVVFVIVKL
jgi:hypothetical protein